MTVNHLLFGAPSSSTLTRSTNSMNINDIRIKDSCAFVGFDNYSGYDHQVFLDWAIYRVRAAIRSMAVDPENNYMDCGIVNGEFADVLIDYDNTYGGLTLVFRFDVSLKNVVSVHRFGGKAPKEITYFDKVRDIVDVSNVPHPLYGIW